MRVFSYKNDEILYRQMKIGWLIGYNYNAANNRYIGFCEKEEPNRWRQCEIKRGCTALSHSSYTTRLQLVHEIVLSLFLTHPYTLYDLDGFSYSY